MENLKKLVKQQIDALTIDILDVIEYEVCFPSFNDNKVLSIIVTKSELLLIPCKKNWIVSEVQRFELKTLQSAQFDTGDLFRTTLRKMKIYDFVRIKLKFEGQNNALRLFVTSSSPQNLVKMYEKVQSYFVEAQLHIDGEIDEDREGLIVLWDYDNIKLKKNGKINTYLATRIKYEIEKYGPLKAGLYCYNQHLSDEEILEIEKIDPLIKPRRVAQRKDEADLKLMQEGSVLIEEKRPARAMLISKDHIFADYSNEVYNSGVELILLQTGGASQQWLNIAPEFKMINLLHIKCRETTCDDMFSLDEEMEVHFEKTHKPTPQIDFACDKCLKVFKSEKAVQDHSNKVHPKKFTCGSCNKEFPSKQGVTEHKRAKGH